MAVYLDGVKQIEDANFAGVHIDASSDATSITLVDVWTKFLFFDTNLPATVSTSDQANNRIVVNQSGTYDVFFSGAGQAAGVNKIYEYSVFSLASGTSVISGASQANPCVITATAHGFSDGDKVAIKAVVGMVEINDRIYTVANKADNTFELNDNEDAAVDSSGYTAYDSVGTAQLVSETAAHSHRKYSAGGASDYGAYSGDGTEELTSGDQIEMYIMGDTDTTNFTQENCTLKIKRAK